MLRSTQVAALLDFKKTLLYSEGLDDTWKAGAPNACGWCAPAPARRLLSSLSLASAAARPSLARRFSFHCGPPPARLTWLLP